MTERKPPELTFTSWIDQQIKAAAERGAFDDLPGAGKPIPNRGEADAGQVWLRDYLRREGVPTDALLPTPLKLRKEAERLPESLQDVRSEHQVREVIAELNGRIMGWRRIPLGPGIFVPLVDEEAMVRRWRDRQSVTPSNSSPADSSRDASDREPARHRRWHRISRRRPL